jgi:chromate transporter
MRALAWAQYRRQTSSAELSAAAAGPLIATGLRLLMPHRGRPMALHFAALAFVGMGFTRLPLLVVLPGLTPLSITVGGIASVRAR